MTRLLSILLGLFSVCTPIARAQTVFYVSPSGDDRNEGTIESPFGTIQQAKQRAREFDGTVTIYMREGTYYLDKPLLFTAEDGNDSKTLTLCPYRNEHVTVSGSVPLVIHKWEPYKKGIMKAELDWQRPLDLLLVDGKIQHMARYPNFDPDAVRFNGTSADATSPKRVKSWKHPEGGYLHAMHAHDWGDFHYLITGSDKEGKLLLKGGHQNNRQSGLHKDNRMVENIFEELDSPGEWYYNKEQSTLYYYPYAGVDINRIRLETPIVKHLVEFRGDMERPVKNITIKGIEFCNTARTFMEPYEPLLRSDWTIYRGGAVVMEGTENCSLEEVYMHNLGGNAVFFSNYNRGSKVSGSHFTDIGASAICFVGDPQAVRSPAFEYNEYVPVEEMDRGIGPKNDNYPAYCTVYDNLINKIGLFEKQVTGVELSMCRCITVSHNSIYDVPRSGINVSEGTWGGHIIEFNDVFDTVKETGDHGSFNSWGRDRFWHPDFEQLRRLTAANPALILADAGATTVIRNNRFRCDRGWDIDLDDGSTNYHIYNNLCLNGGIKLREGFYRIVENNLLINNTFHPHVWLDNSGDVFTRNVVMTPYQPINLSQWGSYVDFNLFTSPAALEQAQARDTDRHSICTQVKFVNPTAGDYTISHDCSEVFRMGFTNFPMDDFGVRSPRLRKMARRPVLPLPILADRQEKSNILAWHGWNIKNLETLGERSATGMDSLHGVYVISIAVFNNPLRDYLKANDVILKLNGRTVDTMQDLSDAEKQLKPGEEIELVVFRNQKENKLTIPHTAFQ